MRRVRLALLALPLAVLAACTSGPTHHPADPGSSPAVSTSPSATQNRSDARAAADRLVAAAMLPPGAVSQPTGPDVLQGPAMGTPSTTQLIDSTAYFRVPMSLSDARAWFDAHPQPGLNANGTSSTGRPDAPDTYGFMYQPTTTSGWGRADLEIGMAAQGSDTAVRVDGVAQWFDQTPARVTPTAAPDQVTIAGGCPDSDRHISIANPDSTDLDVRMLPEAVPTAALSCTYDGMNGTVYGLTDSQHLDVHDAATLAAHIQAIRLGSFGSEPMSCPFADGRARIVAFAYDGRADVDIWQATSGCTTTGNGHILAHGT